MKTHRQQLAPAAPHRLDEPLIQLRNAARQWLVDYFAKSDPALSRRLDTCARTWGYSPSLESWIPSRYCRVINICPFCIARRAIDHATQFCRLSATVHEIANRSGKSYNWKKIKFVPILLAHDPPTHAREFIDLISLFSHQYHDTLMLFRDTGRYKAIRNLDPTCAPHAAAYGLHIKRNPNQFLSVHSHILFAIQAELDGRDLLASFIDFFQARHPRSRFLDISQPLEPVFDVKPSNRRNQAITITEDSSNIQYANVSTTNIGRKAKYAFDFCRAENYSQQAENDPQSAAEAFAQDLLEIYRARQELSSNRKLLTLVGKTRLPKGHGTIELPSPTEFPKSINFQYREFHLAEDGTVTRR